LILADDMERTSGEDVNWEPAVADARVARATARIADRVMVFHVFDSLDIEPPTREETVVCGVRRSNDATRSHDGRARLAGQHAFSRREGMPLFAAECRSVAGRSRAR